jgi:hypothetical protein
MEIVGIGALMIAALVVAGVVLVALYLAGGGSLEA